jgi:hypothetical protein
MIEKDGIGSTRRKALIDQQIIGHPKNPDYLLYHNELLEFFRDFRVLYYREGQFPQSGAFRAGLLAQKPS